MMAPRPGAKGYELEDILRSYFSRSGYFAVRGVPYQLDGDEVTDIDIWLYERPAAATRRRIIVDVKNRKSPKAAERIVWTKGLQAALGVEGAIVGTTDQRPGVRRLAKNLGITLFDGDAINRLAKATGVEPASYLSSSEFDDLVKAIDITRRSTDWRRLYSSAKGALATGLGTYSTNTCLNIVGAMSEQVILAQPNSSAADVATRLTYMVSAFVCISLDFLMSEHLFRSPDDRREAVIRSIRFGQSDTNGTLPTIGAAIGLARKYLENGSAAAKRIEYGFYKDADAIPAEIIAEYASRLSSGEELFLIGKELQAASHQIYLPRFDDLSVGAKSFIGVALDFNGVSREKFANAWSPARSRVAQMVDEQLSLLQEEAAARGKQSPSTRGKGDLGQ